MGRRGGGGGAAPPPPPPGPPYWPPAARRGHRAIHALSLPAACAPETAGEAVARTVQTMLQEREGRTR